MFGSHARASGDKDNETVGGMIHHHVHQNWVSTEVQWRKLHCGLRQWVADDQLLEGRLERIGDVDA
jgi:hypothetical protein